MNILRKLVFQLFHCFTSQITFSEIKLNYQFLNCSNCLFLVCFDCLLFFFSKYFLFCVYLCYSNFVFSPSAIGPLSIPAVKPNSLHRLFTSLSALLRSFAGRSSLHGRLQSLLSYLFVNALIISISPQRNEGRTYLTLTRSNSNAFG